MPSSPNTFAFVVERTLSIPRKHPGWFGSEYFPLNTEEAFSVRSVVVVVPSSPPIAIAKSFVVGTKPPITVRYKIVNVVVFAILNAFTLRKEEDEDFVVGGVLLLTVVLFKDDEKRGVDKDTTEFETIIYILLEERMHNELFESDEKREEVSKKPVFFYAKIKFF